MEIKTTYGSANCVECPACGNYIKSLGEMGDTKSGDRFDCPHCGKEIEIINVEVTIKLELSEVEGQAND
jgi:tRNA(Ile2) C34 agmatinyltransferase TiaS